MSKRKSKAITSQKPRPQETGVTARKPAPQQAGITATPSVPAAAPTGVASGTWLVVVFTTLVGLPFLGLIGWLALERVLFLGGAGSGSTPRKRQAEEPPPVQLRGWEPVDADDRLIDRFVALHEKGEPAASQLLAELPLDDGPVDEDEFERRAAGHFLRSRDVALRDIRRGEPDQKGTMRPAARRFTLVAKGSVATPSIRVRDRRGTVAPSSYTLHDPVIVVEVVEGGVIRPLRTELNRDP